jgi:hypothetical protein
MDCRVKPGNDEFRMLKTEFLKKALVALPGTPKNAK